MTGIQNDQVDDFVTAHNKAREVEQLLEQAEKLMSEIGHLASNSRPDLPDLSEAQHMMAFVSDDIKESLDEYSTFVDGQIAA